MSNLKGHEAELLAGLYLENIGFKILDRNWRNRFCEIDIVATRNDAVHFVEVKYRASSVAGVALEYITPTKLAQMKRGAQYWLIEHEWDGDWMLDAIAITGEISFTNLEFIQNVSN